MKIGILGGSFDPIHRGHLALARESEKQFQLDKILFIPAGRPPHKKETPSLAPASHRAEMVRLALQGVKQWELSEIELKRPGISYTVDTLRTLKETYPDPDRLFFLIGADSFRDFGQWKDPDEILKLAELVVAPRPGYPLPGAPPRRMHWLRMPPVEISASALRQKLEQGGKVSEWVPERVANYLRTLKLYRKD